MLTLVLLHFKSLLFFAAKRSFLPGARCGVVLDATQLSFGHLLLYVVDVAFVFTVLLQAAVLVSCWTECRLGAIVALLHCLFQAEMLRRYSALLFCIKSTIAECWGKI